MSVPVQAQSLSALTNLLANPPQYPRNPTHEVREPLVLYIVRVPGSKDVFLTPLKPPTKASVSLESIQSSLYYLHVASEDDEEVRRSIHEERIPEETQRINPPIHRKPLPPTPHANYPPSARPVPPPKSYPYYQPGIDNNPNASQSERHSARGTHIRFGSDHAEYEQSTRRNSSSPRKFQHFEDGVRRSTSLYDTFSRNKENQPFPPSLSTQSSGRVSPVVRQHSLGDRDTNRIPYSQYTSEPVSSAASYRESFNQSRSQSVAITLIRRDPVSGCQWNVGNISLNGYRSSSAPLDPVSIEITTPGYSRFATMPEVPRPSTGLSDAASIKEAIAKGQLYGSEPQEGVKNHHTFSRVAEYQYPPINPKPSRIHRRTNSSDSFGKSPSPTKQFRQVYSFASPWQGLCTFSNGIDGTSLKCRHTLSSSTFTEADTTANVAELRFNLPWSILARKDDRSSEERTLPISKLLESRSSRDTFRRGLQNFKNASMEKIARASQDRSPSPEQRYATRETPSQNHLDAEMDRLSLSLGREKAGGGFKGTSAKLGKLIIEDEGLKMCDLLVAACMGVWWQHYEGKSD